MQSVEDIVKYMWDFNSETGQWPEYRDKIGSKIRARDKEIVETCKKAMGKVLFDYHGDTKKAEYKDIALAMDAMLERLDT